MRDQLVKKIVSILANHYLRRQAAELSAEISPQEKKQADDGTPFALMLNERKIATIKQLGALPSVISPQFAAHIMRSLGPYYVTSLELTYQLKTSNQCVLNVWQHIMTSMRQVAAISFREHHSAPVLTISTELPGYFDSQSEASCFDTEDGIPIKCPFIEAPFATVRVLEEGDGVNMGVSRLALAINREYMRAECRGSQPSRHLIAAILHEAMHVVGLNHPFEKMATGVLPYPTKYWSSHISNLDSHTHLTYNVRRCGFVSSDELMALSDLPKEQYQEYTPDTLTPYDILALQILFGPNFDDKKGSNTYNLCNGNNTATVTTIWNPLQGNIISATKCSGHVVVSLRPGPQELSYGINPENGFPYQIFNIAFGTKCSGILGGPESNDISLNLGNDRNIVDLRNSAGPNVIRPDDGGRSVILGFNSSQDSIDAKMNPLEFRQIAKNITIAFNGESIIIDENSTLVYFGKHRLLLANVSNAQYNQTNECVSAVVKETTSNILTPNLWEEMQGAALQGVQHGVLRASATMIGYFARKNGGSERSAVFISRMSYFSSFFLMRLSQHYSTIVDNSGEQAAFALAFYNASFDLGFAVMTNAGATIIGNSICWAGKKLYQQGWLTASNLLSFFGKRTNYIGYITRDIITQLPKIAGSMAAGIATQNTIEFFGKKTIDALTPPKTRRKCTIL